MRDGKPLLKSSYIVEVRKALAAAGLPAGDYAGHSFRTGAASAAAAAGLEDSFIQALADGAAPPFAATSGHRGSCWPQRRSRLPASPSARSPPPPPPPPIYPRRRLTARHAYLCAMPRCLLCRPYLRCSCILVRIYAI